MSKYTEGSQGLMLVCLKSALKSTTFTADYRLGVVIESFDSFHINMYTMNKTMRLIMSWFRAI
jgi:hypothetical protein